MLGIFIIFNIMNIFYLDKNPYTAATYLYNKHVCKMVIESAQMLCTAHHHYGNGHNVPYKKAHYNHPSTKWVRANTRHYHWLVRHWLAIGMEYQKRYGREHLTITKCFDSLVRTPQGMPTYDFVQPPQAMPDEYKDKCSIVAYWRYYIGDKYKIATKSEKIYKKPTFIKYFVNN